MTVPTPEKPNTSPHFLKEGDQLLWYEIRGVLGFGGQGVTYLAFDNNLNQNIALKEYFPADLVYRGSEGRIVPLNDECRDHFIVGLDRFINEARLLTQFKHPNIVRVHSVFDYNRTAYIVMEYQQGEDLSKLYRKKSFSELELLNIFLPILDGLNLVHKAKCIHRDVKPANIYIRRDGSAVLIDFGSARKIAGNTNSMTTLVSHGYTPFEQYGESEENQGPWTDIYSLGACLYEALTGQLPPESMSRGSSLMTNGIDPYLPVAESHKGRYSPHFLLAIDKALNFHIKDRPQDVLRWRDLLLGNTLKPRKKSVNDALNPLAAGKKSTNQALSPPTKRVSFLMAASAVAASVIAALLYGVMTQPDTPSKPKLEQSLQVLLDSAQQAFKQGRVVGRDKHNALALYTEILKRDPKNRVAASRIEQIATRTLASIRGSVENGDFNSAFEKVRQLQSVGPHIIAVNKIYDEVKAAQSRHNIIAPLLHTAQVLMNKGDLVLPKKENALMYYKRVLNFAPDNKQANKGIETIFDYYVERAEKALQRNNFRAGNEALAILETVKPGAKKTRLLNLRAKTTQDVMALKKSAKRAFAAGRIYEPPGNNSLYFVERLKQISPRDSDTMALAKKNTLAIKKRFDGYIAVGEVVKAKELVNSLEQYTVDDFSRSLRKKIALRLRQKPSMAIFTETLDKFKRAFESKDTAKVGNLSANWQDRHQFMHTFFSEYSSFTLAVSKVKFSKQKQIGEAELRIANLVDKDGQSVKPSASWGKFQVEIKKDNSGRWKVYW